jgi:hypothetical protein
VVTDDVSNSPISLDGFCDTSIQTESPTPIKHGVESIPLTRDKSSTSCSPIIANGRLEHPQKVVGSVTGSDGDLGSLSPPLSVFFNQRSSQPPSGSFHGVSATLGGQHVSKVFEMAREKFDDSGKSRNTDWDTVDKISTRNFNDSENENNTANPEKPMLQQGRETVSDKVLSTDSGDACESQNLDRALKSHLFAEEVKYTSCSSPLTMEDDSEGKNAGATCSVATIVDPAYVQNDVKLLCDDIYRRFGHHLEDIDSWNALSQAVYRILQAISVGTSHNSTLQICQDITHFIHERSE